MAKFILIGFPLIDVGMVLHPMRSAHSQYR